MSKSSRQLSTKKVNATGAKFHAAPVSNFSPVSLQFDGTLISGAQTVLEEAKNQKSSITLPVLNNSVSSVVSTALVSPINVKLIEQPDPNTSLEPIEQEIAFTNNQKLFSLYTGFAETEPAIVLSSEFIPLYLQSSKSKQGNAITVRETAKVITSKTAINILSQSYGVNLLLRDNREDIKSYIESEKDFIGKLLKLSNDTLSILDVGSYALPVNKQQDSIGSTYEILKKSGYNTTNISGYSETKMWQQSLLEVKRSLTTHSPLLADQNFTRKNVKNDSDPYALSDLNDAPENLKKIWMNPYHSTLPSLNDLTSISQINDSLTAFSNFEKNQYVNLVFANSATPTETSTSNSLFSATAKKAFEKSVFSNKIIDSYISSGKDLSIIANCISKETAYSAFLTKQENVALLQNDFGYSTSNVGDNFRVWDHLIGRFPEKVSDLILNPTGQGKSLVSYSQRAIRNGNDYYNVLTFENNTFENVSITPGSSYYIDSTLSTTDGTSFDISRLDQLINHTVTTRKTTESVFEMMGYNISNIVFPYQGIFEDYSKKQYLLDVSLESMVDKLSIVANTYRTCINVSGKKIVNLDTRALGAIGFKLMINDVIGIRLASLICKLAVYPSGLYTKSSSRLKTLLFLWLINVAIQQNDVSVNNASTILDLKKRIASYVGSVPVNVTNIELEKAIWQYRNIPVTTIAASDLNVEQATMNSIVREKKAATSSYVKSVYSKIFSVDADKGIWKIMVDMLKSVMLNQQIYVNDFTAYSGISKVAYLYHNFDLMLRIVAVQTPENILGIYSKTRNNVVATRLLQNNMVDAGILIDEVTKNQLDDCYDAELLLLSNPSPKYYVNKLKDSINFLNTEQSTTVRQVAFFRKYLLDIGKQLGIFKDYLANNFQSHLTRVGSLYQNDATLTTTQKNALLSLSLSDEQLRLSRYVMSEYEDRINNSSQSETNVKILPAYSDMPSGFIDHMPINEMDAVSYWMLSPYFKTQQFLNAKGNNKKIISVGIPPRLIRSIYTSQKLSTDTSKFVKQNLVRVKLYKLDRMHPDVVYLPKTYLFEMTRFPTRIASNWNFNAFLNEEFSLLNLPSKFITLNGDVILHKNFDEAFPTQTYGSILNQDEKNQVYSNHSVSFLCEEYLRWFTSCKFDETRYSNFSQLTPELQFLENQYLNFTNSVINGGASTTISQNQKNQVRGIFIDPLSRQVYNMPLSIPKIESKISLNVTADKVYTIPIDKTIRSYLMNETFMLSTDVSKRRMSYLKKFDRVFNVLFDPDDFLVDESLTNESTLRSMRNLGILTGGETVTTGVKSPYRHRDTSPNDSYFDEYFVTVEPYDYVQEYRG